MAADVDSFLLKTVSILFTRSGFSVLEGEVANSSFNRLPQAKLVIRIIRRYRSERNCPQL
ncbi:MAG: hypothetical protein BWY38_03288 [Ignavibacteria bacterium ADurb.Bin266]|nr:MAG: hypothetical protein BWY38_03288 [Ignavibacteria bacterium ADurb.Bin266]